MKMDASASEDYEYDYGSDEDDYTVDDDDMSWDATGDNPNAPPVATMTAFSPKGTCVTMLPGRNSTWLLRENYKV